MPENFELVHHELRSSPVFDLSEDEVVNNVKHVNIFLACDTTTSMGKYIEKSKMVMRACIDYLDGIANSNQFGEIEVAVFVVGFNDWKGRTAYEFTAPVVLFLNEYKSTNGRRAVPFRFKLDPSCPAETALNLQTVIDAIAAMAEATEVASGGDAREEYGTGMHFIETTIRQMQVEYGGSTTKFFVLVVTDDAQHGVGPTYHRGADTWPKGVDVDSLYGASGELAFHYACDYAPDVHPQLGFSCWKPHNLWESLNGVLDLGATVVWVAVGRSATSDEAYQSWIGTLATIFEHKSGILFRWGTDAGVCDKSISESTVHILNSLITKASIRVDLEDAKRRAIAATRSKAIMASVKTHAQRSNGMLAQVATSIEEAALTLDKLAVHSDLDESTQQTFVGHVVSGDKNDFELDEIFNEIGYATTRRNGLAALLDDGYDDGMPPTYRSFNNNFYDDGMPPTYRSLGTDSSSPRPTKVAKPNPTSSVDKTAERLLRLMTAL